MLPLGREIVVASLDLIPVLALHSRLAMGGTPFLYAVKGIGTLKRVPDPKLSPGVLMVRRAPLLLVLCLLLLTGCPAGDGDSPVEDVNDTLQSETEPSGDTSGVVVWSCFHDGAEEPDSLPQVGCREDFDLLASLR